MVGEVVLQKDLGPADGVRGLAAAAVLQPFLLLAQQVAQPDTALPGGTQGLYHRFTAGGVLRVQAAFALGLGDLGQQHQHQLGLSRAVQRFPSAEKGFLLRFIVLVPLGAQGVHQRRTHRGSVQAGPGQGFVPALGADRSRSLQHRQPHHHPAQGAGVGHPCFGDQVAHRR